VRHKSGAIAHAQAGGKAADNRKMTARLPDYYAILHVDPAAPAEVIRASYRTLMQRLGAHPDLGGDHETAAQLNMA
jgi:hypothetical protein